jgi:hypothetical protein
MDNPNYPHRFSFTYSDNNRTTIQLTVLCKEKPIPSELENLLYVKFNHYITENKTVKISKNNIIKFLNNNGIECVNRVYHKSNKNNN